MGFQINDVPEPTSVTYVDYDNPFVSLILTGFVNYLVGFFQSLVHEASGSPHVAALSSLAWVACGGDVYILECLKRGYVRIVPLPDNSTAEGQNFRILILIPRLSMMMVH